MWRKSLSSKVVVEFDHRDLTRANSDPETALAVSITGLVAICDQLIRRGPRNPVRRQECQVVVVSAIGICCSCRQRHCDDHGDARCDESCAEKHAPNLLVG